MKYRLILTDKDPMNNQVIECDTAREAYKYKKKAEKMGFKVTIKKTLIIYDEMHEVVKE